MKKICSRTQKMIWTIMACLLPVVCVTGCGGNAVSDSSSASAEAETQVQEQAQDQEQTASSAESYSFDLAPGEKFQGDVATGEMGDYELCFYADLDDGFSQLGGVKLGKGIDGEVWGWYVQILDGQLEIVDVQNQTTVGTYELNMDFQDYIGVQVLADLQGYADVTISTNGGMFTEKVPWAGVNGTLFAEATGDCGLSSCRLSYYCNGWDKDIWLFGDSYFSLTAEDRWTSYLLANGSGDILLNGCSGKGSVAALDSLKAALAHGTPEEIIWCMGMNDGDDGEVNADWLSSLEEVEDLCEERGIKLVLTTVPTCPYWNNDYKNEYVKSSGYTYIDFAEAVGAYDSITWKENMLEDAELRIHPTKEGAIAMYAEAVATVPELLR